MLKEKNTSKVYPSGIKEKYTFTDKIKLKVYVASRPTLTGRSSNRKVMMTEGILKHQERRKNNRKSRSMHAKKLNHAYIAGGDVKWNSHTTKVW